MRKLIAGAALALIVSGAGGTAFAGEITGSGKGGPNGDGTPGRWSGRSPPMGTPTASARSRPR